MKIFESEVAYHAELLSMQAENSVMTAYEKGKISERQRIINVLWDWGRKNLECQSTYDDMVAAIEEEDNE